MLFAIHCIFAPGAFGNAKRYRLEHYTFLREVRHLIVEGGPMLGPDGVPTGMLMIVNLSDQAAAQTFISKEPYNANGYFESVAIRHWSHVLPEPTPGYIDSEYEKEMQSRTPQSR